MPEKIKKSIKTLNRISGKYETEHFYLKSTSTDELKNIINNSNIKLKIKAKCIKELIKRNG